MRLRAALCAAVLLLTAAARALAQSELPETIDQIRPSIVAVGSFDRLRNPQFSFSGTGFAVGDGSMVATNEHVVARTLDAARKETFAIALRAPDRSVRVRAARKIASDPAADLALLKIDGAPLPPLRLADSASVREGEIYLLTGYPIGGVLGLFPVTHRAMIAAITPIAIPAPRADKLDARVVRQLTSGAYTVFQLDGTAYPGNSGSPVYHPQSGQVVGIVNSVFIKASKESALTQPSGITFAIPAQKLQELLERVR
jgi:S1-C subfamily serine protease